MLHDSFVYIFDEATSNIDVESENQIMAQIKELAETKTVILISHRLANVTQASRIYVMERGQVKEESDNQSLIRKGGFTPGLWNASRNWKSTEVRQMRRRSRLKVMAGLAGLIRPLAGFMAGAVAMGLCGHLCASFITVLGGYAALNAAGYGGISFWRPFPDRDIHHSVHHGDPEGCAEIW